MTPVKPNVTVFSSSYPPAYLAGGPARSLHALVEALSAEFSFSVVTSASDSTQGTMQSVHPSRWSSFDHATTWYEARDRIPARTIAKLLRETEPRLIFLNSLFDHRFATLPLLVARMMFRKTPIVLAPRGELSTGALALKRLKKRAFIVAFRLLGFHKTVTWRASTSRERADIERVFGPNVRIHVAIDLRAGLLNDGLDRARNRWRSDNSRSGSLVFFSRIAPKKNVASAIRAMAHVKAEAHLSIAGPIEDAKYWDKCLDLIKSLPCPQSVDYVGPIRADEVVSFLNCFDLFVFPTLGENFGHVVLESLAAGTPAIVGIDTPWHQIETFGAGWVCDPTSPHAIADLIDHFLSLNKDARQRMRLAAQSLATQIVSDTNGVDANRAMFRALTSVELS